jgi:ABC-2 type transport system permease protein
MGYRSILAIGYYYGVKAMERGTIYVFASLLLPLSLFFVFSIISGGRLLPYAVIGGFISIVASAGLMVMADAALLRIDAKIQDLMVATQIGKLDYMLGLGLSNLVYAVPGLIVYLALAYHFGVFTYYSIAATAVVLAILAVAASSFAFVISGIPSHARNIFGMMEFATLVLTLLPPVFYPYTLLPGWVLYIFLISPTTAAAVTIQGAAGLAPVFPLAPYILVAETVLLMLAVMRFSRWRQV